MWPSFHLPRYQRTLASSIVPGVLAFVGLALILSACSAIDPPATTPVPTPMATVVSSATETRTAPLPRASAPSVAPTPRLAQSTPSPAPPVSFAGRMLIATTRSNPDPSSDLPTSFRLAWLSGTHVQPLVIPGDDAGITRAAINPDGRMIAVLVGINRLVGTRLDGSAASDLLPALPPMSVLQPSALLSVTWLNANELLVQQTFPGGLFILHLNSSPAGNTIDLLPMSGLDPAASPDGLRIAVGLAAGNPFYSIYLTDPTFDAPRKLTRDTTTEASPVWSPDGQWIAYAANPGVNDTPPTSAWEIRVVHPDGTGERTIVQRAPNVTYPTLCWSPDGKQVAFTRADFLGHRHEIGVVGIDGGQPVTISRGTANDIVLGWLS